MTNFEYCADHLEEIVGQNMNRCVPLSETDLSIHDATYLEQNGVISISYNREGYALLHLL